MRPPAQSNAEYGVLIATLAILVLVTIVTYGGVFAAWFAALTSTITRLP